VDDGLLDRWIRGGEWGEEIQQIAIAETVKADSVITDTAIRDGTEAIVEFSEGGGSFAETFRQLAPPPIREVARQMTEQSEHSYFNGLTPPSLALSRLLNCPHSSEAHTPFFPPPQVGFDFGRQLLLLREASARRGPRPGPRAAPLAAAALTMVAAAASAGQIPVK
jgi:hypothetical protein